MQINDTLGLEKLMQTANGGQFIILTDSKYLESGPKMDWAQWYGLRNTSENYYQETEVVTVSSVNFKGQQLDGMSTHKCTWVKASLMVNGMVCELYQLQFQQGKTRQTGMVNGLVCIQCFSTLLSTQRDLYNPIFIRLSVFYSHERTRGIVGFSVLPKDTLPCRLEQLAIEQANFCLADDLVTLSF